VRTNNESIKQYSGFSPSPPMPPGEIGGDEALSVAGF